MDSEGRLIFWKPGLWEGDAPTLTCGTCKRRRTERMKELDERPQGSVLTPVLFIVLLNIKNYYIYNKYQR